MIDPRYLRELIEATRQVVRIGLALSIYKPKYPKVSTTAIISTKYDVYLQLLFKSKVGTFSKLHIVGEVGINPTSPTLVISTIQYNFAQLLEFKSSTTVKSTIEPIEAIESPLQSSILTKSTIQPIEAMLNTNTSTIGVKSSVSIEAS